MKSTVSLQAVSINKRQISLTPAFAITEYKVQGATFKTAILELQCKNSITGGSHKAFCSTYVQLSCLQSLDSVQLLQTFSLKGIDNKPNLCLQQSTAELEVLSRNSLDLWKFQFDERWRSLSYLSHDLKIVLSNTIDA